MRHRGIYSNIPAFHINHVQRGECVSKCVCGSELNSLCCSVVALMSLLLFVNAAFTDWGSVVKMHTHPHDESEVEKWSQRTNTTLSKDSFRADCVWLRPTYLFSFCPPLWPLPPKPVRIYLTLSSGSGSLSLSSAFLFTPLLSELSLGPADDWAGPQKPRIKRNKGNIQIRRRKKKLKKNQQFWHT